MERYKKLFIFILSLVLIYYILTKTSFLPSTLFDFPTKKLIKGIIGLAMGIGAYIIYSPSRYKKADGTHPKKLIK